MVMVNSGFSASITGSEGNSPARLPCWLAGVTPPADLLTAEPIDPLDVDEESVGLLQLTSGSTGPPKAVRITHRNLVSNAEAMFVGAEFDIDTDVSVSWLPLFHDMGMTGYLVVPMYFGAELVKVTPMDFLDFRDMLRPASGFQSWQFKLLEARLGLKYEHRYGQQYYTSQLRQPEIDAIKDAETSPSLLQLVNGWLERMPFFRLPADGPLPGQTGKPQDHGIAFWANYRQRYLESLADVEKSNLALFDKIFFGSPSPEGTQTENRSLSPAACRAALFIMLYRGYPILQLPFQVLNQLLEIDEQLSTWRYRHMSMVHRIIGTRIGTGWSTGKDYLSAAMMKHHLFKEVAALTSFLIERRRLPELDAEMERRLGFAR